MIASLAATAAAAILIFFSPCEEVAGPKFLSQSGTQNVCMPFSPFLEGGIDLLREVFWIKSQDFGQATCLKSIFGDTIAQEVL